MIGRQLKETLRLLVLHYPMVLKIALLGVVLLALYLALEGLWLYLVSQWGLPPGTAVAGAGYLIVGVLLLVAYRGLVRLTERRNAVELRFDATAFLAPGGAVLGAALFGVVQAVLWIAGFVTYAGHAGLDGLPIVMSFQVAAAISEELVYRGVLYRIIEDGLGTAPALIVSAAVFGTFHGANPGATLASSAAIALEAGVLLGLAYTVSRSLWFPIGIHLGWNFTEGGIFDFAISGTRFPGVFHFDVTGPAVWTGGAFGPEASVPAVVVCLIASSVLAMMAIRSGRWRPFALRYQRAVSAPPP
jgi:membrane protease YdiL (CAAX protease family)